MPHIDTIGDNANPTQWSPLEGTPEPITAQYKCCYTEAITQRVAELTDDVINAIEGIKDAPSVRLREV